MEALGEYYSSSEDETPTSVSSSAPAINSAPGIPSTALTTTSQPQHEFMAAANNKELHLNLPVELTLAPSHGPTREYMNINGAITLSDGSHSVGNGKEIATGVVESTTVDDIAFDSQYHTYNQSCTGLETKPKYQNPNIPAAPPIGKLSGETEPVVPEKKKEVVDSTTRKRRNRAIARSKDKAEVHVESLGDYETHGIWAPQEDKTKYLTDVEKGTISEEQQKHLDAHNEAKKRKTEEASTMDEDMDFDRMVERKMGHLLPARLKQGEQAVQATSEFLGDQEYDYQGRSWTEPPRTLRPDDGDHDVYLPKKNIHTWTGHTKGVQAIELFPQYGHLLLSGSHDHTLRIWDVYNERKCKRVYDGHRHSVRDLNFSNDGKQFLSCSFDRFIQLWDTETGQSIHSFTNRRVPYCIRYYPEDNNSFVIGDSNNMVVQFDARSGEIVQEYNHHLQAVNSVTFVDDNRRFVSTSDDKKILIWEWGIPVPVKYISEPAMHSMPSVSLHPSGNFFAGQSLNNQIDVYQARDKFKLQRKKVFKGHDNAGYACQIGFSPNGQYIVSGDGKGNVAFWDWKSTRLYKKLRAHEKGPCMGVVWHPLEPSRVVTCGWDGLIKYWD